MKSVSASRLEVVVDEEAGASTAFALFKNDAGLFVVEEFVGDDGFELELFGAEDVF